MKNPLLIAIVLCLLFINTGMAQQQDPFGVQIDTAKSEAIPFLDMSEFTRSVPKVELETYLHFEIGYQGLLGSCVGHAISHCLTIQRAYEEDVSPDKVWGMKHSASFIFNLLKKGRDCEQGVEITEALKLVKEKGVCLASTFSDDKISCKRIPTAKALQEAKKFKIGHKYRLFSPDSLKEVKIAQTKWSHDVNYPVVVTMRLPETFSNKGFQQKEWDYDANNCGPLYYHAMVVLNYNEERQAFLLLNSLGREWGHKGTVWIDYDDFAELAHYGFILIT